MADMLFLPLLVIHIASGAIALPSGLCAMASRKAGTGLHARAGHVFYLSMSSMAASAAILTAWEPDRLSLGAAIWTFYLVHSARDAAVARTVAIGPAARWFMPVGLAAFILFAQGGLMAEASPTGEFQGSAATGYLVFGTAALLSLLSDLYLRLRAPRRTPRQRITRHLWRMVMAYFLAATSLFLGQQDDVFPFMAGSPVLLLPSLLTLLFLLYWLARVRFTRNWLGHRTAHQPGGNAPQPQEEAP